MKFIIGNSITTKDGIFVCIAVDDELAVFVPYRKTGYLRDMFVVDADKEVAKKEGLEFECSKK